MALSILRSSAVSTATTGPDRHWIPSSNANPHYKRQLITKEELPTGFPSQVNSKMAWSGRTFQFDSSNFLVLLPSHVRELEEAAERFEGMPIIWADPIH
jgi:hypothetical protein